MPLVVGDLRHVCEATKQCSSCICGLEDNSFLLAVTAGLCDLFICFSIESEEKPSHKSPTTDGSKQNYSAKRKKKKTNTTKPNNIPNNHNKCKTILTIPGFYTTQIESLPNSCV